MKQLAFCVVTGLALTGCSIAEADTPEREDCMVLASDPAAQESFSERGLTTESFCDCVVAYIDAQPETEEAQMQLALEELTGEMESSEVGAEEGIGTLMAKSEEMDEETAQKLLGGIRLLGGMMNKFGENFSAGDACPIP